MSLSEVFETTRERRVLLRDWINKVADSLQNKTFQDISFDYYKDEHPYQDMSNPKVSFAFNLPNSSHTFFTIFVTYHMNTRKTTISASLSYVSVSFPETLIQELHSAYDFVLLEITTLYTNYFGKNRLELLFEENYIIKDKSSLTILNIVNRKK